MPGTHQQPREWNPGDSPILPPAPEDSYPPDAVPLDPAREKTTRELREQLDDLERRARARAVAETHVYTDDEESFRTGTALIRLSLRVDARDPKAIARVINTLSDALQPFAEITRPLHSSDV